MATILIIDDTPTNLGVMVGHLETQGYRVLVAQDGEEGLQRAELMHPDLILLDVMMPGPSGFEVCRRLKSRSSTHEIPVIFMTSLTETRDKVAAFAAGAVDYVTKPLQADEVMARIDTHLKLRAAQSQLEDQNTMLAMYREDLEDQVVEREHAEEQVRRLNKQLEAKVAERTEQLSAANRELQTYPDLLTYARTGDAGVRAEAVALEPLVRQIVDAFNARIATAGVTVEVRTPLALPQGDAALIGQILANLLDNACNHRRPDVALQIHVSATRESGTVLLRVADNGIGIAPAHHARIFEVFERPVSAGEHPGSGVGLAIAAKSARLMGGAIAVESAPDQGSTFTVSLPAARADSRQDR
ncbi:MAG: response regulator [Gammaproteobacteria bacterium]|nr:response regulator [Gammaproteobacteria bacterium]